MGAVLTRTIVKIPEALGGEFAGPFSGSVMISADGWSFLAQRMGYIQ